MRVGLIPFSRRYDLADNALDKEIRLDELSVPSVRLA